MLISKHNLALRCLIHNNARADISMSLALHYISVNAFESRFDNKYGVDGYRISPQGTTDSAFISFGNLYKYIRTMHTRGDLHAYYKK